ncbi:MAG: hypothetical protein ACPLPS_10990, partial [bacterium]
MRIALLILLPIIAFSLRVEEMDDGYTLGVEGRSFRARINKKFPSFLGVLHDAGCPTNPYIGYFYGWWTSSDFPVEGKGWVGLHMPLYKWRDIKVERDKKKVIVTTEVTLKDDTDVLIRSRYFFKEGICGFEMEREFIARNGKKFGPYGFWLGGALSEFPISNATSPDSYFYEGKWRNKVEHSWLGLSEQKIITPDKDYIVIFYWAESKRYLIIVIVPQGFEGGIKHLQFCWRGNWKEPAWGAYTGLFSYGKFKARFIIGRGSKEVAVRIGRDLLKGIWAGIAPGQSEREEGKGNVKYIENGFYRLGIDVNMCRVISLRVDLRGKGKYGANILVGKRSGIYFGGPSQWQRSIYPSDAYSLYLKARNVGKLKAFSSTLILPSVLLYSPEGIPFLRASLSFSLKKEKIFLRAEFESLKDVSLPYLGWHLDFPANSWKRFYNSVGGYFHLRMLGNYKMSIY